ncbi:hypothetical protein BJ878DRAFT_422800 [Calycina marina]|uniref:DnaJ homologue subfamily C member 28 conserved domain-containing protein n=1 Tax=Calycina marina TaxID=1763456 RepID=A0A9P7Z2P1_9HELO|nr:hypothetical protein BJ878DRAFT_422800 [Calycina marina]
MPATRGQIPYTCYRCLRASRRQYGLTIGRYQSSNVSPHAAEKVEDGGIPRQPEGLNPAGSATQYEEGEQGAMSMRLAEATEETLYEGGRAGRKAVEDAGFSDELREKLLEKIQAANFRSENAAAFATIETSNNMGRGSKYIAAAPGWTGVENTEDTVLRMLNDAKKPLRPGYRGSAKIPSPIVDLGLKRASSQKPSQRLANARDKSSIYSISKDSQMTDKEREDMKRELKERFTPGARATPSSLRGLAALANERIEDAIARGQFKNIRRGKAIARDARADNPFIDTTEYILNKMIQRQDISPPWIEKQQELVKTANSFRGRLRHDWKRHAARTIASRGGDLIEQLRLADRYAEAERIYNPKKRAVEQTSVPTNATSDPIMVNVIQESPKPNEMPTTTVEFETVPGETAEAKTEGRDNIETTIPTVTPLILFRIPAWEAAEMSYLTLAINNLNSLTRSYNLMAPDLAKKSYFSLDRELRSCYADVAPQLVEAIKERAARPAKVNEATTHSPGSVLAKFSVSDTVKVYESSKPHYGLREFWTDLFDKKS